MMDEMAIITNGLSGFKKNKTKHRLHVFSLGCYIIGLLWNLSSANELKEELTATALPALTQHVVVPYTSLSDTGPSSYIDPSVFNCATGCLR